jgi:hypothetical protein
VQRAAVAAAVVLAVTALASCATVSSWSGLIRDLEAGGFTNVSVNIDTGDEPYTLVVKADAPEGDSTAEAQEAAAEIVWNSYPSRFEELRLTIEGETEDYTRAELNEQFGARPEALDEGTLEDDITRDSISLLIGLLVLAMVVVLAAAVTALLVLRSRKVSAARRRRVWADAMPHPTPWAPPGPMGPPAPSGPWASPGDAPPTPDGMPAPGPFTPAPPPGGWVPVGGPLPPSGMARALEDDTSPREWDIPEDPRERKADVRLFGRRPRGAKPPTSHLPPGWDN